MESKTKSFWILTAILIIVGIAAITLLILILHSPRKKPPHNCPANMINPNSCKCGTVTTKDEKGCLQTTCKEKCETPPAPHKCPANMINPNSCKCGAVTTKDEKGCLQTTCKEKCETPPAPHHTPTPAPHHTPTPAPHHTPTPAPHHTPTPAPHHTPTPAPHHTPTPAPHHTPTPPSYCTNATFKNTGCQHIGLTTHGTSWKTNKGGPHKIGSGQQTTVKPGSYDVWYFQGEGMPWESANEHEKLKGGDILSCHCKSKWEDPTCASTKSNCP